MSEVIQEAPGTAAHTVQSLDVTPPAAPVTLGTRVIRGAVWILIQSLVVQGLSFLTRVIVFRRLKDEEIALALWATGATMFISWIQPSITEVIMQRQRQFRRWANSAFWVIIIATALFLIAAAILAPLLAAYYGNGLVTPIVLVTCAAAALQCLGGVWNAQLSITFDFRRLTIIGMAGAFCTTIVTIFMAWRHMGAWTIAVPPLFANALMLLMLIYSSPFRPSWTFRWQRIAALWQPAVMLSVGAFFSNLVMQADNFFLGRYHKEQLAAYGLAYTLSLQLMQLVSRSLRGVMLPALSAAAGDATRAVNAYLESVRTACLLCMPMSILLIPAAPFLLLTIFSGKWAASIELFQIFLAGIGFTIVFAVAFSTMQSHGHAKLYLVTNIFLGVSFSAMAWLAASHGNARVLAISVASFYAATSLVCCLLAAGRIPWGLAARFIAAVITPFVNAMAGAGAAFLLVRAFGWNPASWASGIVALIAGTSVYTLLAFIVQREAVGGALQRFLHALPPPLARAGVSMVATLRRIVGLFPTPIVYHAHRLVHRFSGKPPANAAHLAYLRQWPDPPRVVAGPFKGMIFTRETYSSSLVPSLLGCYEAEIHEAIEHLCTLNSDLIADIGAGEGYYAVGLALRNPGAQCVGFEMFKPVNHILGKVAKLNGVAARLARPGMCTPAKLEAALARGKRPVLLCDCEGAEDFLLDPDAVPSLKRTTILVELHDHMCAGVSDRIRARFAGTHTLRVYTTRPRTRADLPAGYAFSDAEFEALIVEHRNTVQQFFLLEPRG